MDSMEQLDDLVRQCQRGDRQAFEAVFNLYQPRLRFYVLRLAGADHTEDLLQEAWIRVIRKIKTLRDVRAFPAWLYSIARREVISRARIKDPFVGLPEEDLESLAVDPEPAFAEQDADLIHQALDRIKAHHREILALFFLEDLSHKQIAEVLGVNVGTVKSRLYWAKQSLRAELERRHG
ncbi:MAG: RNA polymerase sigma factor [Phycisphaerae bacterium]|nr:RNA polymerase sigma factor [Phycisphaerae bacterium]